ncbi:MAG TPA: hypothetical protein PLU30_16495 [Verrucomicrobiae bacterium]|nr:hypothetical protein [Verrucomicrobiae bacterium]
MVLSAQVWLGMPRHVKPLLSLCLLTAWLPVFAVARQGVPPTGDFGITFARDQWDRSAWAPLRLPHQSEPLNFTQRDSSIGTGPFTEEERKKKLDNVILMLETHREEGEVRVVFSLSEEQGAAPGVFLAPAVTGNVLDRALVIFVASYTMAVWRAETDPATGETTYAHLVRVNRWNQPNQRHTLRCRFSKPRNSAVIQLDASDPLLFKDLGLDFNSRVGIWGCHGTCDFYEVNLESTPRLEWSTSKPRAGIDYAQPQRYVTNGAQTTIGARYLPAIDALAIQADSVAEIQRIIAWKRSFRNVPAGGRYVGVRTVNDILASHELTGCHDHGMLLASVLRHFRYPAIMVDATGINWSLQPPGTRKDHVGHVFVETYVGAKWMLLDSTTGRPLTEYDPQNPVIPVTNDSESTGFYVMFKGVDPAGYGIRNIKELNRAQDGFAERLRGKP